MKSNKKLTMSILFFAMAININKGFGQNFYKDFIKYQDNRAIPREHISKSKIHSMNVQFASELKKVFNEVRRKTGVYMLDCDTIYFFSRQLGFFSGGYSELIWNANHSCYYENLFFSPIYQNKEKRIISEDNAGKKLAELDPVLKRLIQNRDTVGYQRYVKSPNVALGAGIKFMVAIKMLGHWSFLSSKVFASTPPD